MNRALKIVVAYLAFGVLYEIAMIAYCIYRHHMGNPSDLPCVSLLWTSIGLVGSLLGWPLMAFADVISNAVVAPTLVRASGMAFLGGFIATLAWVLLRPPKSSR